MLFYNSQVIYWSQAIESVGLLYIQINYWAQVQKGAHIYDWQRQWFEKYLLK